MKKTLLASAAVLVMTAAPALADGAPTMTGCGCWYAGLSAGANWLQNESVNTAFSFPIDTSFDAGWALSAQVGYRFHNGFRTELEFAYRKNDVGSIDQGGPAADASGDVSQTSLIANVLYDIHLTDDFSLSLGAGAGMAGASVDIDGFGRHPLIVDKGDGWGFAWQLIGGVNWSLSPNTELYAEYHYMRNDRHDVTSYPTGIPRDTGMDLENSSAMLGVRFAFGQ